MRLAIVVMTTWLWACGGKAAPAPTAPGDPSVGRAFDREAGEVALTTAADNARTKCPQAGQPGVRGEVRVTFAPSGQVTSSRTTEAWGETPIGLCVLDAFDDVQVPPFDGDPVTMTKSVDVP